MQKEPNFILNIDGMTCVNCQDRIKEALLGVRGVKEANVDYKTGKAEVYCDETVSQSMLARAVAQSGYRVVTPDASAKNKLAYTAVILLTIVLLYALLAGFGVLNLLVPSQLGDSSMGYGMLFVVGLLTSVHCIAMCGGINLSQCLPKQTTDGETPSARQTFLPTVFYNLGRVVSYTVIGFIMGLIGYAVGGGAQVGIPLLLQGILKFVAGILMVVMGLNTLGVFPFLRKITPRMPAFLTKIVKAKKREGGSSFVVGILNGIMPCGPLQSMWIVALATASPFKGALSMLLFALGTTPLMLGLGTLVAKLGQTFNKAVLTVGATLVVVMGFAMLSQSGTLTGWLNPVALLLLIVTLLLCGFLLCIPITNKVGRVTVRSFTALLTAVAIVACVFQNSIFLPANKSDVAVLGDNVQTVESTLRGGDYPTITVQVGIPVKWTINAPTGSVNGCNHEFVIKEYGIRYAFHEGENLIEFTPESTGVINYSCWMGMIFGTIIVVDTLDNR